MSNPYAAPRTPLSDFQDSGGEPAVRYAGFWIRVLAAVIDSFWITVVIVPLLFWLYGGGYFTRMFDLENPPPMFAGPGDFLLQYAFPALIIVLFWIARQATPGKMALSLKIVDAKTLGPITKGQAVGRYLGYYVSSIPLMLGLMWVGFDPRKQGWHDKMAGTVVIHTSRPS